VIPRVVETGVDCVYSGVVRGPDDAQDDALADRARRGHTDAFALLFYRYKLDVWNLACFKLSDHHEAEDAVQETFLRAYRSLNQYRGGDTMRPWLLTICRNVCTDRLRRRPRRPVLSLEDPQIDERIAVAEDHDRRIDLRRALAQLPAAELEAFFLVDVLGCRSEEAARILELPASSTLRSRVSRARRHIASALSDPPPPGPGGDAEIWGLFHAPPVSAIVVTFDAIHADRAGAARAVATVRAAPCNRDLVEFFDLLEHRIPPNRRVVAIVGDDPTTACGTWLADHPRWRLERAATRTSWIAAVGMLLQQAASGPSAEPVGLLDLLNGRRPFLWTPDS